MLNKQSMPVWMLNDVLAGLLGGGVIVSLTSVTLLMPHVDSLLRGEQVEQDLRDAKDKLGNAQTAYENAQGEIDRFRRYGALLKEENDRLAQDLREERQAKAEAHQQDLQIRRELLGLRGEFARALFLIDISGSIGAKPKQVEDPAQRPNWGSEDTPWLHVRGQVDSWLRHLPVGSFRLICFNHKLHEFPGVDDGWLSGEDSRRRASEFLAGLEPNGYTFTELALERAAAWNPTTIILFTDGAPTDGEGRLDPEHQTRILARVNQPDWQIPINVIALNDYLTDDLGPFLQKLAGGTGGGFMGL